MSSNWENYVKITLDWFYRSCSLSRKRLYYNYVLILSVLISPHMKNFPLFLLFTLFTLGWVLLRQIETLKVRISNFYIFLVKLFPWRRTWSKTSRCFECFLFFNYLVSCLRYKACYHLFIFFKIVFSPVELVSILIQVLVVKHKAETWDAIF